MRNNKKLILALVFLASVCSFSFAQNKVIPFVPVNYRGTTYYAYCSCFAVINGVETLLAIDTGLDFTLVSFPVEPSENFWQWKSYGLYGSRYDFDLYEPQSFIINGEDFSKGVHIAELPDNVKSKWNKDGEGGILGFDVLTESGSVFKISPTNGNIEFAEDFDTDGYESCDMYVVDNKCIVKVYVDGQEIWAIIDTGYMEGTFALPVLESKKIKRLQEFVRCDGDEELETVYLMKNVRVFDRYVKETFGYVETPFTNTGVAKFAVIGKEFLRNYELIFNLKESKLYYKRNSDFKFHEIDVSRMSTGILETYFTPYTGKYIVTRVLKGSEADKKGIRPNQEIYSENGLLASYVYEQLLAGNYEPLKQLESEGKSAKKLKLVIKEGENLKEITLKKRKIF